MTSKTRPMTSMTSTMVQIAAIASSTTDVDALLRQVDSIQIALEMAERPVTAEAFITLSEAIQAGGDVFLRVPEIARIGMEAENIEPDALTQLAVKAKNACRHLKSDDAKTLFEISVLACGLASWLALVVSPNRTTLIRVEDALLEIGRRMSGVAITRLTGKVVPAGF